MPNLVDSLFTTVRGLPMRCSFHRVNGDETIPDDVGVEVPDIQTAQWKVLKAIEAMQGEVSHPDEDWRGWRLNVLCLKGAVLLSLRLDDPFK